MYTAFGLDEATPDRDSGTSHLYITTHGVRQRRTIPRPILFFVASLLHIAFERHGRCPVALLAVPTKELVHMASALESGHTIPLSHRRRLSDRSYSQDTPTLNSTSNTFPYCHNFTVLFLLSSSHKPTSSFANGTGRFCLRHSLSAAVSAIGGTMPLTSHKSRLVYSALYP
jgi:hypothetical protein